MEDLPYADERDAGWWPRFKTFVGRHRRRIATLSLGIFLAAVALEVGSAIPREADLVIPLGASPATVREARIDYYFQGESFHHLTLRYPEGAPASHRHQIDLSPGTYEVRVTLDHRGGRRERLLGRLEAPAEGVSTVRLQPVRLQPVRLQREDEP